MIKVFDNIFKLDTENTSYILEIKHGLPCLLYYGRLLSDKNLTALCERKDAPLGSDAFFSQSSGVFSLEAASLDFSPQNKGDYRINSSEICMPNGGYTTCFCYSSHTITKGGFESEILPFAKGGEQYLELLFTDASGVAFALQYGVFDSCNVITRRVIVRNNTAENITIRRLASMQIDLPLAAASLYTFDGAWARERHKTKKSIELGTLSLGSTTGASSNTTNPFFMVAQDKADEKCGDVYGFNLIYSGNHEAFVQRSQFSKVRIINGINSYNFNYTLASNEQFETPTSVLSFSKSGFNGLSQNMHSFVNKHIVSPNWAAKERPILLNNWEATYFDFNETKLLRLARAAKKVGIELFVLDDGWFGTRNNDMSSLGDYNVNKKKLPSGLDGLCKQIKDIGLQFGIWVEPEMVNPNSDLFRAHPEWVVATPEIEPSLGRFQLVLDLCRVEVQDYIIENVSNLLKSADIRYLKWDMNRHITDSFSGAIPEQGRFYHEYILGLYRVIKAITKAFPEVLFESCSSGGNRFDLGMLCYMPQVWTSDDTDYFERLHIQSGSSYGYPQSVMGNHVSASPNHQTLRKSPLESRFNLACFGLLGYELDLTKLSRAELKAISAQTQYYKQHRAVFQFGKFTRLSETVDKGTAFLVQNQHYGAFAEFHTIVTPNRIAFALKLAELSPQKLYKITGRGQYIDIKTFGTQLNYILPIKVNTEGLLVHAASGLYMLKQQGESVVAGGDLLMYAGLAQRQIFSGTGYNDNVRLAFDYYSGMFLIEECDE